jgi:hypothetical protein
MKRTLLTILAVILTSVSAFAQTKVSGEKIVNSSIFASTVDGTAIGQTSRSSVEATWEWITSGPPNPTFGNSLALGWNATGIGEVDFVDDFGTGTGGFNWYLTGGPGGSHSWSPSSPAMILNRSGLLQTTGGVSSSGPITSSNSISTTGAVTAASMSATTFTGSLNGTATRANIANIATAASALAAAPANCGPTTPASGVQANGNANCGSYPFSLQLSGGYETLPGGVIIQYATGVSQSTSGGTQIVNFPINFPHNCWSVQVSALVPSPVDSDVSFYQIVGWSANSVTVFLSRNADHAFQPTTPIIFAIGN